MKQEIKNHGHSIRIRLMNFARQAKQPFMKVLARYFQERLLYRLSISGYKQNFLLKGGALLYAFYNFEARPTIDIDFLGNHINRDIDDLKRVFYDIMQKEYPEDGVMFDASSIEASEITINREYNGVRLSFTAHLDTIVHPISMDIGFGDIVTPRPQRLEYPTILENMPVVDILAYSLETVIAEKFEAMISLGEKNSRMKDFFDVYRLLTDAKVNEKELELAILNTFKNRNTIITDNHVLFDKQFFSDTKRIAYWNGFLRKIKWDTSIDFQEVGSIITKNLKPIYDELTSEINTQGEVS